MKIYNKPLFFISILFGIYGIIYHSLAIKNSYNISILNVISILMFAYIIVAGIYNSTSREKTYEFNYNKKILKQVYKEEFKDFSFFAEYSTFILFIIGYFLKFLPFKRKGLILILYLISALSINLFIAIKVRKKYNKLKY